MPIDLKRYPPNWNEIREKILLRANNCCENCGLKNGQKVYVKKVGHKTFWFGTWQKFLNEYADGTSIKEYISQHENKIRIAKVVLTIAHLDHDETNWQVSYDRLKALCQLCHLTYDVEEKKKRRKNHARKISEV